MPDARRFEATLGWRPIDRPGKIAVPSAWREIAPGREVQLLEVSGIEPSPASTRPAEPSPSPSRRPPSRSSGDGGGPSSTAPS